MSRDTLEVFAMFSIWSQYNLHILKISFPDKYFIFDFMVGERFRKILFALPKL